MKRLENLLEEVDDFELQLKHLGAQDIKHHSGEKSLSGDFSTYYWLSGDYNFKVQVLDADGSLYSFDMGKGIRTVADYRNDKWINLPSRGSPDWAVFDKYRRVFE